MQKKAEYVGRIANSVIPSNTERILSFHLNNKNNCFHKQNTANYIFPYVYMQQHLLPQRSSHFLVIFKQNVTQNLHNPLNITFHNHTLKCPKSLGEVRIFCAVISARHSICRNEHINLLIKEWCTLLRLISFFIYAAGFVVKK